ncbi:hypothetical protein [Mycolicibacterium sp. CBMA 234]|nr:hypothetical protein [Mycolicibacterium sp. CBMA 234]
MALALTRINQTLSDATDGDFLRRLRGRMVFDGIRRFAGRESPPRDNK